jgi:hypothetical protein
LVPVCDTTWQDLRGAPCITARLCHTLREVLGLGAWVTACSNDVVRMDSMCGAALRVE